MSTLKSECLVKSETFSHLCLGNLVFMFAVILHWTEIRVFIHLWKKGGWWNIFLQNKDLFKKGVTIFIFFE